MGKTSIEWCDHTVNPIRARDMRTGRTGHFCEKIASGCTNCYASRWQLRRGMPTFEAVAARGSRTGTAHTANGLEIYLDRKALTGVLTRKRPTQYFWCDMTDMFGDWVTDAWLDEMLAVMLLTPQHTHLLLTKRINRAFRYFTKHSATGNYIKVARKLMADRKIACDNVTRWPLPNIKLGVSASNQDDANHVLPTLLVTPAGGHYISIEPQIGPITIKWAACSCDQKEAAFAKGHMPHCALHKTPKGFLDQVIDGGESGPGARPFNLQWPRSIIRQCHELGIPAFIKQLGSFPTMTPIGTKEWDKTKADAIHKPKIVRLKLKKRKGNDPAEWPDDLRVREPMK